MRKYKSFFIVLALIPLLACCSSTAPGPDDQGSGGGQEPDPIDDTPVLTVKAVPGWGASFQDSDISFAPGDQIGVYCINAEGTSYYNVPFSTVDGETFTPPEGRTLSFDSETKVYAYYPYVKDAIRTLIKDVQIPLQQSEADELKDRLFFTAKGSVEDDVATLSFTPVQSVVALKIHNSCGQNIPFVDISLDFGSTASGIFKHDLQNDPSAADFALSPMIGTGSNKVVLSGSGFPLADGGDIDCLLVCAPLSAPSIRLQGYAGDGEYWSSDISISGSALKAGEMRQVNCTLTPSNYSIDIYVLIETMNLLATSDYSVPEKYQERMRQVSGVQNVRDFGGIDLEDGGKTAYGVIFRSAALEGIKEDGKTYMTQTLGVKTDIDLRNPETGEAQGYSPLGSDIFYFNRLGPWYVVGVDGIKEGDKRGNLLEILRVFSDKRNYPLDFHCQVGRDRTGTVGGILAGLAGATRKAFYIDYLLSFYAACCHEGSYTASGMATNIIQMYDFLSTYKSESLSLSANTEAFLIDLGLTAAQVAVIKEVLLTGDISVVETESPTFHNGSIESVSSSEVE